MISKRYSLPIGLMLIASLQGCGGGGVDSESTNKASEVNQNSNTLNTLSSQTTPVVTKTVETSATTTKTVYRLKEKLEVFPEFNTTTTYTYDGNYSASSHSESTNGMDVEKRYTYNSASHTLDVKVKNVLNEMVLSQRALFEEGESATSTDLARNDNQVYLYSTFDPITYHDNVRIVKNITDIDLALFNVKEYSYSANNLSRLTSGYQESLDGDFIAERSYRYSYEGGLHIDGKAVNLNHTFTYSDDNKTVTEFADGKMLRKYIFEVEGE